MAKALNQRSLPRRGARAAQSGPAQQFGAASLSIVGPPPVTLGDNGGLDCSTTLTNNTSHWLGAAAEPNWPTDTWNPGIPFQDQLEPLDYGTITFVSDGGLLRGCSGGSLWVFVPSPEGDDPNPPMVSFTTTTTYPWSGQWSDTCVSSDPQDFPCLANGTNGAGNASWIAYEPPHQ